MGIFDKSGPETVIDPSDPLNFLAESPVVWSDERIKALIHYAPSAYKARMAEIENWRRARVERRNAAEQSERERLERQRVVATLAARNRW